MNIRDTILQKKLLSKDPYIYPMSAIRDEEIFKYFMDKYIKDAKVIVETGTYCGTSSLFLSQFCSVCHTFDVVDYKEKYPVWKAFGVNTGDDKLNIEFHLIKDDEEKKQILNVIDKIDFAFIDGLHFKGVDKDFELFKSKCNKFLFHDYEPQKCVKGRLGMWEYVRGYLDQLSKTAKVVEAKPPFIYMEV